MNVSWQITSPIFVFKKKHKCLNCSNIIVPMKINKIVNSKSPEAKDFDFSCGDSYLSGDVKFNYYIFYCKQCNKEYGIKEIRDYEKKEITKKINSLNGNKVIKNIKIMFCKLFYGAI